MEALRTITEPWAKRLGPTYKEKSEEEKIRESVESYNASIGTRNLDDGYDCPLCKNKGFISVMTTEYGKITERLNFCKCDEIRRQRLRLKKAGLLDAVSKLTFDRYQVKDRWQQVIKETALRFCQDDAHNVFFIGGQSGAGKTHICTAITAHYINQGKKAKYMVWFDEATRIKGIVNEAEEYSAAMRELKESEVLYIDDLFKPIKGANGQILPPSYADIRLAMEIINYRYNNPGKITIISGERTIDELLNIDEALAGRISELSKEGGYCINLQKDSKRNWRMRGVTNL